MRGSSHKMRVDLHRLDKVQSGSTQLAGLRHTHPRSTVASMVTKLAGSMHGCTASPARFAGVSYGVMRITYKEPQANRSMMLKAHQHGLSWSAAMAQVDTSSTDSVWATLPCGLHLSTNQSSVRCNAAHCMCSLQHQNQT